MAFRLWAEFILLFVIAPLSLFLTGGDYLILGILVWSALGAYLLHQTRGFEWSSLFQWPKRADIWRVVLMAVVVLAISSVATWIIFPERFFNLPLERTGLWLLIILLYPLLSALPQEIVCRALYFERYGAILPKSFPILLNALVFMFIHIAYGYPIVLAMTFAGGIIFASAYLRGEFMLAVLLHAVAGNMIFTSGLGWLFCAGCGN